MSAQVESRRFRTWESDAPAKPRRAAWIMVRFGFVRMLHTWYLAFAMVVTLLVTIVLLGSSSYSLLKEGLTGGGLNGIAWGFALPFAVFLFMVGSPLFAEDVRFNAPLFYFSKPLRTSDYFTGKVAQLGAVLTATSLVPVTAVLVLALLLGLHGPGVIDPNTGAPFTNERRALWETTHIDSFPEWAFAATVTLIGLILATGFLGSLMAACSAFTRRAWHAAMAFVAILGGMGFLGLIAEPFTENAFRDIFGPFGWLSLALNTPLDLAFTPDVAGLKRFEFAVPAVLVAYAILAAATFGLGWTAQRRLQKLEAIL